MKKINLKAVFLASSLAFLIMACESDDSAVVEKAEPSEVTTIERVELPVNPVTENIEPVEPDVIQAIEAPAKVIIKPVASASSEQFTNVGTSVVLDGSASSSQNKGALQYRWTLTSRPSQSTAKLTAEKSVSPSFTADQVGLYKVTLFVNDGVASSTPSTVTIHSGNPVFAFSNNTQGKTITTYAVDSRTGLLTNIATTSTEAQPVSMVLHPDKKYLYVAYVDTNEIAVFSIDELTGSLKKQSSISANAMAEDSSSKPNFIYTDASGQFLYVLNQLTHNVTGLLTSNVSVFDIQPENGQLTALSSASPPFNNWSMGVHMNGQFAYIPSYYNNNISTYSIDKTSGKMSHLATVAAKFGPSSIAIIPNGNFVYSANYKNDTVSTYSVDPVTGVLFAQGSVQTGSSKTTGIQPVYIVIHPSGKFAYTANFGSGDISVFNINQASGELTLLNTVASTVSPATEITSLSFDSSGLFLYSMTVGSGIWIFSINTSSGDLTEVIRKQGASEHSLLFTNVSSLNKKI